MFQHHPEIIYIHSVKPATIAVKSNRK